MFPFTLLGPLFQVQKIYLTFMAELLGDVAGSLGPPCESATAASVLSSFQEGHFLSSVSAKDQVFSKGRGLMSWKYEVEVCKSTMCSGFFWNIMGTCIVTFQSSVYSVQNRNGTIVKRNGGNKRRLGNPHGLAMEVYSWENHRTIGCLFFQQDISYRFLIFGKTKSGVWWAKDHIFHGCHGSFPVEDTFFTIFYFGDYSRTRWPQMVKHVA